MQKYQLSGWLIIRRKSENEILVQEFTENRKEGWQNENDSNTKIFIRQNEPLIGPIY